jgi:hypothetical protein
LREKARAPGQKELSPRHPSQPQRHKRIEYKKKSQPQTWENDEHSDENGAHSRDNDALSAIVAHWHTLALVVSNWVNSSP